MTTYHDYEYRFWAQGSNPSTDPPTRVLPDATRRVGDARWESEAPGGYIGATLTISRAEFDANAALYVNGTTLEIVNTADGNDPVWAGKLLDAVPGVGTNKVKLTAHGWGKKLRREIAHMLWQTRDEEQWQLGDSDPHGYSVSGLIEARIEGRRLEWRVRKNTTFKKTSGGSPSEWRSTIVFWAESVNLRRIAFDWEQDHDDDYTLEVCKANGPTGALTVIDTIGLGSTTGSYNSGSVLNYDTSPFDLIALRVVRSAEEKKSDGWWLRVKNIRVNGPFTAGDTYETYKMMQDIAGRIGASTSGIGNTTTNGLPADFLGEEMLDVATDIGVLDDRAPVVVGNGGNPILRYREWNNQVWVVTDPHVTFVPTSVERITEVWVPYMTSDGVERFYKAQVPTVGGIRTIFKVPFERPYPPQSAAAIIAPLIAAHFATERVYATFDVAWVEDAANPGVPVPASRIKPGQTVRIAGYDLRAARLAGGGPTVQITVPEIDPVLERILARQKLLLARGRSRRRAAIDALGIGRPSLVATASITGTFKRHRKKNRHTQIDLRVDWGAVTTDIRGNPTVIRAHRVQLRPVDGLGAPISEAAGGKILEKTVRDKDTGDSETIDTREWFRDLERPFAWNWQVRIETIDIQGKVSRNGTKSFTDWVSVGTPGSEFNPPAPTGVTLDVDPHNTTAVITQPADDEDPDDVDDRIHRTTFILFKNTVKVRQDTVRAGVLRKSWRIKASPGDTFDLHVYNRDSENRRSTTVTDLNNNLANPPDPLSAPTIIIDKGGKKKRRITVTGTYAGSWTDSDVKTAVINALIDGKRYKPEVKLDSDGTFEHVFRGIDKDDAYNIEYLVKDGKGNESGYSPSATGTVTDITPPSPSTPSIATHLRKVIVSGYKTTGDKAEVDEYLVEISTSSSTIDATFAASIVDSERVKGGRVEFNRAQGSAAVYARVSSFGPSGVQSSYVYGAGSAQPDTAKTADLDRSGNLDVYATYKSGLSGERLEIQAGSPSRIIYFNTSGVFAGEIDFDDTQLDIEFGAFARIRMTSSGVALGPAGSIIEVQGPMQTTDGRIVVGLSNSAQNYIDFRNTGGIVAAPSTGYARLHYRGDLSPSEFRVRFPSGITKTLATDT